MRFSMMTPIALFGGVALGCAPNAGTSKADSPAAAMSSMAMDPAAVRQSIEALNMKQADAIKAGDAVAGAANYSDDAVVMMSNTPAWKGHASIEKGFGELLNSMDLKDPSFQTLDVTLSGDFAFETGTYKWMAGPKGGKLTADSGKYLTVWKKQVDGSWKIIRDMSNSDIPLPTPGK